MGDNFGLKSYLQNTVSVILIVIIGFEKEYYLAIHASAKFYRS